MEGNKKQIVYITGAMSFSNHGAFLEYLRNTPIDNPLDEKPKRWSHTLPEQFSDAYEVFMLSMPNKQNAKYEEWKIWFERHVQFLRGGVVLVGWSQGAYFLLKYLSENRFPLEISALFLVASPVEPDEFGEEDGGDFNFEIGNLPKLEEQVEQIFIYHSKDDFVVPFSHAEKLSAALPKAALRVFEDRNHFLQEKFPELVADIKAL